MENCLECIQCLQLSKRVKEEKAKNSKKKNLINLFKELLYAHDIKLSNFSRTNLRDVYNKYLIDGEHVRQRLSSTLSSLNEITEAYSAANQSNESLQKKAQDLEAKLKHLEFLNKQLSEYYNQVETQNKKQKAGSKYSKLKKELKKTDKKLSLKVEAKSDPPSPLSICSDKDVNIHSNNTGFPAENSVVYEESGTQENGLDSAISDSLKINSNLSSKEQENVTFEQELLKAKDFLDSFSDCGSHSDYVVINDEDDLTEISSTNQLLTNCFPDKYISITEDQCNLLIDGYETVSSEENKSEETNKLGRENILKNSIYSGGSPVDSGIFSANTSPAISEISEQNLEYLQKINKQCKETRKCSNPQLTSTKEIIKKGLTIPNCDNISEKENNITEMQHLAYNCVDSYDLLKSVGENVNETEVVNQIVDNHSLPDIISPIRSSEKSSAENCSDYFGSTHNPTMSKNKKQREVNENMINNISESSQMPNSDNFSRDTMKCREKESESLFHVNEDISHNKIQNNDEQDDGLFFSTSPEIQENEQSGDKKVFIKQNCIFPKSKLLLSNLKTVKPHSTWCSTKENINWIEKFKLQDTNSIDYNDLCKVFKNHLKLKSKPLKKTKYQKQAGSTLYNNLFKSVTSNGLAQAARISNTSINKIKTRSNLRVFGDFTEKSRHNESNCDQDFCTFPNNHENLFSSENASKKYFSHLKGGFKTNYDSFFKYRDNHREQHISSQVKNKGNEKNTNSVTITYRLISNDFGYPCQDEVLKFSLIHPIVKVNGLKNTCIVVNSMYDLVNKIRVFTDELERFYVAYINKTHANKFSFSQWNCKSSFNEFVTDSKPKEQPIPTCNNYMNGRDTTFSRMPCHQSDNNFINDPSWTCCQTLCSNINPLLMKSCCTTNSHCNQENIGIGTHNEKCNINIFKDDSPSCASSNLKENVFIRKSSFPSHSCNSVNVSRELHQNISSENTISFPNASEDSILLLSQPNSPISVASNNSDISEKNKSSFAASPANNNLTELNKINMLNKKKNSEGNEKRHSIQNTKKERKQSDYSAINDFGKLAVNEKADVSNYVSSDATITKFSALSGDNDCQDSLLLASHVGPKSAQFNKDNTKFTEEQTSEAVPVGPNLTLKTNVFKNDGQRITDSGNSSKIVFNDKVALKTKYVSLKSPIKEVELTNNFQNKGAVKQCINQKLGSYSDFLGCSTGLKKKSILGTPSIAGNDAYTAINNNNCYKSDNSELPVSEQIMSTHDVSKLDGIRSSMEMRPAKDGKNNLVMKACKEKYILNTSSNKQSVTCDSGNGIVPEKENIVLDMLPISHSNHLFDVKSKKKGSKKSVDSAHSAIKDNETNKNIDDNSKKKKINHSSSDNSENMTVINQNVNFGKNNLENKVDDIKKVESSSTNKSCTLKKTKKRAKTNKQIFAENRIHTSQNTHSPLKNPQNLSICNQNINTGKLIFENGTSVDKKDENYTKNKSCIKNNTPSESKKELNTHSKNCKENVIQKVKTLKKPKCKVTETETSINENFAHEGINSDNAKVVTGNELEENELSEINATVNSILKEYELIKPLSPLPEIEEEPEMQTSPTENLSPESVKKKTCDSMEKQKSLSQKDLVIIDQNVYNAIEELGDLNNKKINHSGNRAEELYNLTLTLFDQTTTSISNSEKSNILENNVNSTNSINPHIINNIDKEIDIGITDKLISHPSVCHNVKQNDTEIITVNKLVNNRRNEYITDDLVDNQTEKCSTSLKLLNLKELHEESFQTVAMLQQSVIIDEKESHFSHNIYDLDYTEKDLDINIKDIELSGICSAANDAEYPIRSEIEILADHDNNSMELKSSCSSNDGLPSEILNYKLVSPCEINEGKEDFTPKIENNPTQMPTIKDRLRPRKDSFVLTPVKVYTKRNRKSSSPKLSKLLSNDVIEEIEKTQTKKKEITDETNIDVGLGGLPNLELELGDISLNETLSSCKSDDDHRLNELYNEVDNLITLDYRGDETQLSFVSQPQLSYLPNMSTRDYSATIGHSVNVSAANDNSILQKKNRSSSEKEMKETKPVCIGFYRDRSEEEEERKKTEAQNESASKKIPLSPNYLNDSDQHFSTSMLDSNKSKSFNNSIDNVHSLSPCGRRADKRKRSVSDCNLNSKNPRITSSEEIVDCKDDSAMRATLRYITNKILQEGKPVIIRRKKAEIEIEDKRIKSYIDSFVATSNENSDKLHDVIDALNTFDIKIVVSAMLETIVSDKQEMIAPIGSNRMPPLTQVQKRLLMLTISLAQFNKLVYDEVLNSLEESLASFRDKTINVTNGCKMIFFYTVLCRSQGFLTRARSLLLDILYTRNRKAFPVVLKMVTIWPFIIPHASFSSGCLLTSVFIYILSSTYIGPDRIAKREAAALKKNIMTKYGYSDRGQESQLTRDELFREILSRITERGSGLALLLLAKFEGNIWATKMVESALFPLLQKWLHAEKTAVGNRNDNVAAEIALALGRIVRGFPRLSSRILINNSIKIFERMLNETNNFIVMEAVVEALVMLRRHNLPMCAAALAKWHPKGNVITTKIVDLIRSVLSVKPLTHWLRFLTHIDS